MKRGSATIILKTRISLKIRKHWFQKLHLGTNYQNKQSNKKLMVINNEFYNDNAKNTTWIFPIHTGAYWGIRLRSAATRNGRSPCKNLEFFALSRVTNGQFPLVSSFKQKKITQKFIHLFAKYWSMELSAILRYSKKNNNHTYLKLIQLNQEKKQGSLQMKSVIQQSTWNNSL